MTTRSTPERLDEAVQTLLAGERPTVEPELRPLVRVADRLADVLRPLPASRRFEADLGRRLAAEAGRRRVTPGRLLAAGAISSAAVGVTVTAYAVWRSSRRTPALSHRLLQR
jgi:hypothetical protein